MSRSCPGLEVSDKARNAKKIPTLIVVLDTVSTCSKFWVVRSKSKHAKTIEDIGPATPSAEDYAKKEHEIARTASRPIIATGDILPGTMMVVDTAFVKFPYHKPALEAESSMA